MRTDRWPTGAPSGPSTATVPPTSEKSPSTLHVRGQLEGEGGVGGRAGVGHELRGSRSRAAGRGSRSGGARRALRGAGGRARGSARRPGRRRARRGWFCGGPVPGPPGTPPPWRPATRPGSCPRRRGPRRTGCRRRPAGAGPRRPRPAPGSIVTWSVTCGRPPDRGAPAPRACARPGSEDCRLRRPVRGRQRRAPGTRGSWWDRKFLGAVGEPGYARGTARSGAAPGTGVGPWT